IDRGEADRIAAVAGAVGPQRLAVGERVLAVGVTLTGLRIGAVDAGAKIDLCGGGGAESLTQLRPRGGAAPPPEKFFVRGPYAEGGARAAGRRRPRRRDVLLDGRILLAGEGIGVAAPLRLRALLLHSAEEEVEQALSRNRGRCSKHGSREEGGHTHRATPPRM